jgi:O-antigen ligase
MRLARALSDVEAKKVQTFILLGGVFTTLAIWTKLEDPVNLPKMFALVLSAAAVLGLAFPVLLSAHRLTGGSQRIALGLVVLFIAGLLVSTVATDVKYTAIYGEYHRKNGAFAYLAMAILMAAGAFAFNLKSSDRYLKFYAASSLILTAYGFLQAAGKDPVGWTIDYNPFITTLGNPNFTSGFLGLSAIVLLLLTIESTERKFQAAYAVGLLADLYILKRSGSIQGFFGFLIGAAIIVLVKLWIVNKKYGQIGLVAAAIAGAPVALAVINVGPLASRLYQGTLANRLDYWNAALNMFKDYPIFGVGIDRYGEYYRQYAVQNQVVQGQITDNAHSVYMQILATGGLVTFVPYMLVIGYLTFIGFKAILKATGSTKLRIAGIFGIWLGTVALNIVTIDNLGVAVWFWITGGVLIATSSSAIGQKSDNSINGAREHALNSKSEKSAGKSRSISSSKNVRNNSPTEFPITTLISGDLVATLILIMLPIMNKSIAIRELKNNSKNLEANAYVAELNKQVANNQDNPQNLILLADVALRQGEVDLSYQIDDRIRQLDARSFYGQYLPAVALEATSKPADAIKFREKLVELDPWNTSNMLQLIRNYLAVGDKEKAAATAALIKRNYPGSQSDIDAEALLVG